MKRLNRNDLGKFLVEQCQQVCINDFLAISKQKLKRLLIQSNLKFDASKISLAISQLSHGGLRYWFKCPECHQRVGKLYKHPLLHSIACRKCNNLEYRCRKYKGMVESKI